MKELTVGMIGSGMMGKAHSIGYKAMPMCFWPTSTIPKLYAISDATPDLAKEAQQRFGFEKWIYPWKNLVKMVDIDLVDIVTPNNLHKDMCIEAAETGKHLFCEKLLALNGKEAREILDSTEKAGVKHCVDFNYRYTPAVMLAKQLINEGRLGNIHHFKASYLQDFAADPTFPLVWRFQKAIAGSGALGDIGSHIIDMVRFLIGEFTKVTALMKTIIDERPLTSSNNSSLSKGKVDVDDAIHILAKLEGDVFGSLEASRFAYGRKNFQQFEIYGSKGSLIFNYERMNELQFYSNEDPEHLQGFKTILTGPPHPYGKAWWPIPGLNVGFDATVTNIIYEFITGIVNDTEDYPNFYDGWKCNQIIDGILQSVEEKRWVDIQK